MTATPKFVQRVARLPEVFAVLAAYPEGLTLQVLADQFDTTPDELRDDLLAYVDNDWAWMNDIFRPPVIDIAGPEPNEDEDSAGDVAASVVRIVHDSPGASLGVEHLSAGDLALVYTAGLALLDIEDDEALAGALGVIAAAMYGEEASTPSVAEWNRLLPLFQRAQAGQLRVDIVYSNAWRVGVSERTIEPLKLVLTNRGWEVDAGPVGPEGNLRTYLLSNIRSAVVSDEVFEPPPHLESRLTRQRKTTTVRLALAQRARWAPDMYAEKVRIKDEDESEFIADLDLLPPVAERIALMMLASGGSTARVLEPTSYVGPVSDVLRLLLEHHEQHSG